jgi:hypothetical protein
MGIESQIIIVVGTLLGALLGVLSQQLITSRNQKFELQKEKQKLEYEIKEKQFLLLKEKTERIYLILEEISKEFSVTFLTIDSNTKLTPQEYDKKYSYLHAKIGEAKMIAGLYIPTISSSIKEISGMMNLYWGYFRHVLSLEENGEIVNEKTPSCVEAFKYAQEIPRLVRETHDILDDLFQEVRDTSLNNQTALEANKSRFLTKN